jgi:hypothetical protein
MLACSMMTLRSRIWACVAVQVLYFDDMYVELLLMDEEDLVAALALHGAPAHSDAHSETHSTPEEAGSDGNDAVSVDWDE